MSTRVKVLGIPKAINAKKLIQVLGHVLKMDMNNVYVNILPSPAIGSTKDALLTFKFPSDAELAQEKLDDFVYTYNNEMYVLAAKYDNGPRRQRGNPNRSLSPGTNLRGGRFNNRNVPDRRSVRPNVLYREDSFENQGQSRMLSEESSELDKQIEILKKQRLILEEERKLLMEQQKLQELKMKLQLSETAENPVSDTAQSSQPDSMGKRPVLYHKASGVLIGKMSKFINQHTRSENRKVLLTRLRSTLSDRIIALVNGQPIYRTQKVLEMYRQQYPESEDESLVMEIVQNLDEIVWAEGESLSAELEMDGGNAAKTTHSGNKNLNIKDKVQTNSTGNKPPKRTNYYQARKVLLRRMNAVMDLNAEGERRKVLVALLRHRLKDRIEIALAGRPIYQTYKVLQVYREVYTIVDDEDFVKELLKEIDENKWSFEDVKNMSKKWNQNGEDKETEQDDGADTNDSAKEEKTATSAENDNKEGETEAVTEEVTNNSVNPETFKENNTVENEAANNDETTKPESSVENKDEEVDNEKQSVNATSENSKPETIESSEPENTCLDTKAETIESLKPESTSVDPKHETIESSEPKNISVDSKAETIESVEPENISVDSKLESTEHSEAKNNGMDEERKGVKRRNSTTDDGEAKLAKIWEAGAGDLDVPIEMDGFEDWN